MESEIHMEWLIKTYSNNGGLVLDNTMGIGSTMIACKNTNRIGIGIEKENKYYDIAIKIVDKFQVL
jgi:site-specific DNA-methyltransferase (adenine-specific)